VTKKANESLPPWWRKMFGPIILVSLAYGLYYQFSRDGSLAKGTTAGPAAADSVEPPPGTVAAFAITDEAVLAGEEIYDESCSVCHGAALEGGIGPSFLDDTWTHGDDPTTVVRIITEGVPENGMLAWESILTGQQINHVAAFVLRTNREAVGR
jgi:cytochrome c oxidase cbb3-type subunit 3